MKFNKHLWKTKESIPNITVEMVESKIKPFFPNSYLEKFDIIGIGLANLNIHFKLKNLKDSFLLRIYNRDHNSLNQEILLKEKFGDYIPMPEFLYIGKNEFTEKSFVIQRWLEGSPFYKILETDIDSNINICIQNIAETLSKISKQKFPHAGVFNNQLEVVPYNSEADLNRHSFISYIEDCLFKEYAGQNLGNNLRDTLWNYIEKNKEFFPPQEPACLVHGDFNFDNILIGPDYKVIAILDWEYAFTGSYLFDLGTFLRFELPLNIKKEFIHIYEQETNEKLPLNFEKMIKIQDITNLFGLMNQVNPSPERVSSIIQLINEILLKFN